MSVTNKQNYALIEVGDLKMTIPKSSVIITESEDSLQLRLNGSRQVLVSFLKTDVDINDLNKILY